MKKDLGWEEKKKRIAMKVTEAIGCLLEGYGVSYEVYIKLEGKINIYRKGWGGLKKYTFKRIGGEENIKEAKK